jgi:hypothetical protein
MSVYLKLMEVQSELKAPKNQYNTFGKYNYRSCEDIMEGVKPHLKKHKALLIVSDDVVFKEGRFYVKSTATFIDAETGEKIEATAEARECEEKKGMDAAQVTGSASSYARKYALNGLFAIDDTKDSDATNKHDKEEKKEEKTPQKKEQTPQKKEDFKTKLGNLMIEMYKKEELADKLEELTTFEGKDGIVKGKRELKLLSEKQAQATYGKLKKIKEEVK